MCEDPRIALRREQRCLASTFHEARKPVPAEEIIRNTSCCRRSWSTSPHVTQPAPDGKGSPCLDTVAEFGQAIYLTAYTGRYIIPTRWYMTQAERQERVEQFDRICRERGFPLTIQRRTIFRMILDREDHPTADQVYDQVRNRIHTISRTSVYRILDTLVELGVIRKIYHPGSAARFDPKTREHHHLVCLRCERIFDVEDPQLAGIPWPNVRHNGFEIQDCYVHFRGICAQCRKASGASSSVSTEGAPISTGVRRRRLKQRSTVRRRGNKA